MMMHDDGLKIWPQNHAFWYKTIDFTYFLCDKSLTMKGVRVYYSISIYLDEYGSLLCMWWVYCYARVERQVIIAVSRGVSKSCRDASVMILCLQQFSDCRISEVLGVNGTRCYRITMLMCERLNGCDHSALVLSSQPTTVVMAHTCTIPSCVIWAWGYHET